MERNSDYGSFAGGIPVEVIHEDNAAEGGRQSKAELPMLWNKGERASRRSAKSAGDPSYMKGKSA
jgi:hypothetical protein